MAFAAKNSQTNNRVVMVGGGSAGHVIPALPVLDALLDEGFAITYLGSRSGLEQGYLGSRAVDYRGISAGKLRRYFSWQNFADLFRIVAGLVESLYWIARVRPAVLFSKGGFVSLPPVVAAWLLRVPVVAHESDLTPGLANRLSLPFISCLCTSFRDTVFAGYRGQMECTGTPVRAELLRGNKALAMQRYDLSADRPVLLVTGGSLGAEGLNAKVRAALPGLLHRYQVVHVCGVGKMLASDNAVNRLPQGYQQLEYVSDGWGDLLAAADVVISRAGATALFELMALSKLNLLVPLPAKASRGDQLANAAYAEQQGLSIVIQEEALSEVALLTALQRLQTQSAQYKTALNAAASSQATVKVLAKVKQFLCD